MTILRHKVMISYESGIFSNMTNEREGDSDDFESPPSFFPYEPGEEPATESEDFGEPVEVQVEGVFLVDRNGSVQRFVLLTDGERKVSITIGSFEAGSITLPLEGAQPDRPNTHDLMKTLLERLDVNLHRVVIDDIWNGTYYAKLHLETDDGDVEIDSRPSDAIALALRWSAPIYVADGILERGE